MISEYTEDDEKGQFTSVHGQNLGRGYQEDYECFTSAVCWNEGAKSKHVIIS